MSRRNKIEPVEKIKIVEQYLDGEIGIRQAGRKLRIAYQCILLNQSKNNYYSKDLKISAIHDYLNEEGFLQDICTKYGIRSHRQFSSSESERPAWTPYSFSAKQNTRRRVT